MQKKIRWIALLMALVLSLGITACAAEAQTGFSDIPADAWYGEAVELVQAQGLMRGVSETRFAPEETFSRAQLATVLYRIAGEPAATGDDGFSDTAPDAWYASAVLWAVQSGVVNGVGGGRFAPNDPVTQEQLAVMLWRMKGQPIASEAAEASPYAAQAVTWARENGMAFDGFSPKQPAIRAQVAVMLQGYLSLKDEAAITLTVAGQPLSVQWAENSSVDALRALLQKGDLTLDLSDYGGFEKGAPLPETLPENNEQMQTDAGDIILYQGRQFVIYYDQNSYSLTPLGKITGISKEDLRALLGAGNVAATLSLASPQTQAEKKTLVAYFSATGNTRPLAKTAAELLGADLYEITPETPYTSADLNYSDHETRATREQHDDAARPEIGGELPDFSRYDTVILAHPIWWGQAPKILYTFLESGDFSGKTLTTFCTSGSSGVGSSAENLKKSAPGASWLESRRFAAGASETEIQNWLESIGLLK